MIVNGTWGEYLSFRRMITPVFIQIIFWIFVAIAVIGGLVAIANDSAVQGIFLILLGPLFARIYAEILIVIFRINDNVAAIRKRGDAASPPPPGMSPTASGPPESAPAV
jgi:hypothetical protein